MEIKTTIHPPSIALIDIPPTLGIIILKNKEIVEFNHYNPNDTLGEYSVNQTYSLQERQPYNIKFLDKYDSKKYPFIKNGYSCEIKFKNKQGKDVDCILKLNLFQTLKLKWMNQTEDNFWKILNYFLGLISGIGTAYFTHLLTCK